MKWSSQSSPKLPWWFAVTFSPEQSTKQSFVGQRRGRPPSSRKFRKPELVFFQGAGLTQDPTASWLLHLWTVGSAHMHRFLILLVLCDMRGAGRQLLLLHTQTCWSRFGAALLGEALADSMVLPQPVSASCTTSLSHETHSVARSTWGKCWAPWDTAGLAHEIGYESQQCGTAAAGSLLKNSFLVPGKLKTCWLTSLWVASLFGSARAGQATSWHTGRWWAGEAQGRHYFSL